MADHRGTRDAIGQMARPIAVPWVCSRSGDCCRIPGEIVVSTAERAILESHSDRAARPLVFRPASSDGFHHLHVGPCPFLGADALCQVYEQRPYNCRRMMCGRVDVTRESYEQGGPMGCHNLSDRIETSLRFQEFYEANERRHAKAWALAHGWGKGQTSAQSIASTVGSGS